MIKVRKTQGLHPFAVSGLPWGESLFTEVDAKALAHQLSEALGMRLVAEGGADKPVIDESWLRGLVENAVEVIGELGLEGDERAQFIAALVAEAKSNASR